MQSSHYLFTLQLHHINIPTPSWDASLRVFNFVLMWLHNRTGNRNIFYLHWPLICATWNRIYLWFFYHTGCTSMERFTVEPKSVLFLKLIIALITLIFHTIMDYFFVGFKTSLRFDLLMTLTAGILSTLMDNVWMFWIIFIKTNMLQKKKPWLHTTTLWASSSHTRVSLESFSSTSVRPFPSQKVTTRTALSAYKFLLV